MSASSTPTFWPDAASAAARLTVTDDLPTPPLPLATAYTWVSEAGWANGISRSTRPPRSRACSSRRCSSLITSRSTATADTPGTAATAAVTSRVMVSRSGQPASVRYTSTLTRPSGAMSTFLTMPRSVIGRRISGSLTRASASVTCAVVGGGVSADELMASCYVAPGPNPGGVGGTVSGPSHTPWSAGGFARGRVQQVGREAGMSPAEHVVQRAGQVVEGRAAGPLPAQPVVLDERQHRGLVGGRAADVVGPGVGRDDQQRQPLAVAAAVLDAAHRRTVPADPGAVERVQRRVGGGVDDRRHDVVVPAVRVVVGDHDRGAAPELGPLDRVDRVHQEVLLVDRVGVARVPVLVRGGLEVAHGGQVPLAEGLEEPAQVVLVVGRAGPANHEYDLSWFFKALGQGNLPAVSYLKAASYQDGHAGYSDPIDEQHFLVNTINAIQRSKFWRSTAIVITYDDTDGWYDHVMPPIINSSADPALDALNGPGVCGHGAPMGGIQDRCGYGQRLPLLVISPYARADYVSGTIADQTSILAFIEDNWLGGQRTGGSSFDNLAGSLNDMFSWAHPDFAPYLLNPVTGEPTH